MSKLKIGIIKEGKTPPDSRVPLTPKQCRFITENYPIEVIVAPSEGRCYKDEEYLKEGVKMGDVTDCDVLMGVKEVPVEQLIPNKLYHFFSHTIKKQAYNRKLLQACVEKNIQLMDYEVLVDEKGKRLIAFGVFAGMVGAHNALLTYGNRTKEFHLPRMNSYFDYAAAVEDYKKMTFPPIKIVLTGTGRVGKGAKRVLDDMGIREVSPKDYLTQSFDEIVYTQLRCRNYVMPKDENAAFSKADFYAHPETYQSSFAPYTKVSDIMINGIYWDNAAPQFFTKEDMKSSDFAIQVIADVTCDIAPISSIPSTLEASTIADPIFGYDPQTEEKCEPHQKGVVDMMTIDNLPNELPRDASASFGQQFIDAIIAEYEDVENSPILNRATITKDGDLTQAFEYLRDYLEQRV